MPRFILAVAVMLIGCAGSTVTATVSSRVEAGRASTLARRADAALSEILKPDYHRPFNGVEIRYAPVRAEYLAACKEGDTRACWMVSQLRDPDSKERDASADGFVLANCRAGDMLSCRALSDTDKSRRVIAKWPGWAGRSTDCFEDHECVVKLHDECDTGFPLSCVKAANIERSEKRNLAFEKRAVALAIVGCGSGLIDECDLLAHRFQVTESEHSVANRVRCATSGEHCDDNPTTDPIARRDRKERECQWSRSDVQRTNCAALVQAYANHEFPEPVPNRFVDLRDWYCRDPVFLMPEICRDANLTRPIAGGETSSAPK